MTEKQVEQFWAEVERMLVRDYRLSKQKAKTGIAEYRQLLHNAGIGDTVYNRGEDQAADSIAASLEMKLIKAAT
jgi:hypothetical protein